MVRLLPLPWVCQMMPALALAHPFLRLTHTEVLVVAADLLHSGIEHHEIMDHLQKTLFLAELRQRAIQWVLNRALLFPGQVILLGSLDHPITQPLGIVPRHDQLYSREERLDKYLLLVVQILADALAHRYDRALQLQHTERDAIHVQHYIRPFGMFTLNGDLFGDSEVVIERILPVDQPDGFSVFTYIRSDLHSVAQQTINVLVNVVEAPGLIPGHLMKLVQSFADERVTIPLPLQEKAQVSLFDITVVLTHFPVAQIRVSQLFMQ